MSGETPTGTITAIRPLPADPSQRSILVDGRVAAHIRDTDVQSIGLDVGMPWTETVSNAVTHALALQDARTQAMRLLGRRALSTAELRDRLAARDHDARIIDAVIDELTRDSWIDDAALGRDLAECMAERQQGAASYIAERLKRRRINPDQAATIADEAVADQDAVVVAAELLFSTHARWRTLPRQTQIRRAAGLLARKGYDDDVVREALRRCGLDPDDPVD